MSVISTTASIIIQEQSEDIERLKRGEFTPEEFQNLCHNRTVQDGYPAFIEGCANYQREMFGRCERSILRSALLGLRNSLGCWCKRITSTAQDREHDEACKAAQAAFDPEKHYDEHGNSDTLAEQSA